MFGDIFKHSCKTWRTDNDRVTVKSRLEGTLSNTRCAAVNVVEVIGVFALGTRKGSRTQTAYRWYRGGWWVEGGGRMEPWSGGSEAARTVWREASMETWEPGVGKQGQEMQIWEWQPGGGT